MHLLQVNRNWASGGWQSVSLMLWTKYNVISCNLTLSKLDFLYNHLQTSKTVSFMDVTFKHSSNGCYINPEWSNFPWKLRKTTQVFHSWDENSFKLCHWDLGRTVSEVICLYSFTSGLWELLCQFPGIFVVFWMWIYFLFAVTSRWASQLPNYFRPFLGAP